MTTDTPTQEHSQPTRRSPHAMDDSPSLGPHIHCARDGICRKHCTAKCNCSRSLMLAHVYLGKPMTAEKMTAYGWSLGAAARRQEYLIDRDQGALR